MKRVLVSFCCLALTIAFLVTNCPFAYAATPTDQDEAKRTTISDIAIDSVTVQ